MDQPLLSFARDLVRIPSVLGDEHGVAERTIAEMRLLGFDDVEIDEAGNAVGVLRGASPGPTLVLDAHMDTVDVMPRAEWTHDPFGGEVVDGRLYGRGTSDMKGALAAMVHAVGRLDRESVRGKIVVSASVGEELIEGAALRVVMQRHGADFVVIGEASDLNLVRAGRGRAEFRLVSQGQPAHASSPERGVNAVHVMQRVIEEIERLPMPSHEFVGEGVMCLTDIISVPYPAHSVVPSACRATYERRLLPGETQDDVLDAMREACARAGHPETEVSLALADYTSYTGVSWEQPKWFAPWEFAEDDPIVALSLASLRDAGFDPELASYQFCTNGAYSGGYAGVPTIGFGPSSEHLAHVVDEYIEIEQLEGARGGYAAIARGLLSGAGA
ncbi:MAG: YgeY family selenium metabolism-linked hydrolase [Acidobacteria bacterium]|nr:YgeY family selenium metabolism-linked hydrolase [Acidobacteriota bacterium]